MKKRLATLVCFIVLVFGGLLFNDWRADELYEAKVNEEAARLQEQLISEQLSASQASVLVKGLKRVTDIAVDSANKRIAPVEILVIISWSFMLTRGSKKQ